MAQQYFTIPSTGVYGTYKFYENDLIPMELAVELGIEGAALTEPEVLSDTLKAAIAAELANPTSASRAQVEALITSGDAEIEAYVDGRAKSAIPYLPRISGGHYDSSSALGGSNLNFTLTANRLVAVPFYVPEPITIDRALLEVVTLAAASQARIHLYYANATTGLPGAYVTQLGEVDVSTTGIKSITGLSQVVSSPNDIPFVWLVVESNGGPVLRGITGNLALFGTDMQQARGHIYTAHTYGTALPDPFGTGVVENGMPRLGVRVA